jgi:hypothetical protein
MFWDVVGASRTDGNSHSLEKTAGYRRDQDLPWQCQADKFGGEVDATARDVVADDVDWPEVHACSYLVFVGVETITYTAGKTDSVLRCLERRDAAVADDLCVRAVIGVGCFGDCVLPLLRRADHRLMARGSDIAGRDDVDHRDRCERRRREVLCVEGRKSGRQLSPAELEDLLASSEITNSMCAEAAEFEAIVEQVLTHLDQYPGSKDLPAVPEASDPCGLIDGQAVEISIMTGDFANMDPDPHPQFQLCRPILGVDCGDEIGSSVYRVTRVFKHDEVAVAFATVLDDPTAVRLDGIADDLVETIGGCVHCIRAPRPES